MGSRRDLMLHQVPRRVIKTAAAAVDAMHRPDGIVVLIYHRVGGRTASEVDLPVSLFQAQIETLAGTARLTSLDDAVSSLGDGEAEGHRIVVTFDDGTADFVDHALPILIRHRVPAALYLATSFVEDQRRFPWGAKPLSWTALAEVRDTGLITVGSHTHNHILLDRVDSQVAAAELDLSTGLIQDRLGIAADHFAYPKALLGSPAAQREVQSRFRSAAVAGTRANRPGRTDRYRLARSPIQVSDGMRWWRHKVNGGMRFEDDVRRLVNRRRYAGATT